MFREVFREVVTEKKEKRGHSAERRRMDHYQVPPIWIPDGKTSSCMRCDRSFCVASTETSLSFIWTMYLCVFKLLWTG